MTSRKKPGVAFWATVVLVVVLVGYPLSFGPWCWAISRSGELHGPASESFFYQPILWMWWKSPQAIDKFISRYANLGAATHISIGYIPAERVFCVTDVFCDF
jgi:hypothetical protein